MSESEFKHLQELAEKVCSRLRGQGAQDVEADLNERVINFRLGSGRQQMHLGALLAYYLKEPLTHRDSLIERYMSSLSEHTDLLSANRQDVLANLMPIVRSDAHQYLAYGATKYHTPNEAKQHGLLPSHSIGAGLRVYLAIDSPNAMAMVNEKQLNNWGASFDAALSTAMHELRERSASGRWYECGPGVFKSKWGDGYDSSRLLLPSVLQSLPLKAPVFMAPVANVILATSGENPQALALMAKQALSEIATIERVLTLNLLTWKDSRLQVLAAPEAVQRILGEAVVQHNAWRYAMQQDYLVDVTSEKGKDLFVAASKLLVSPSGVPRGVTVWSAGASALLPEVEKIALVSANDNPEEQVRIHGFVTWGEAIQKLGHLLEKTEYEPARFLTKGFPSPEELKMLRFSDMTAI